MRPIDVGALWDLEGLSERDLARRCQRVLFASARREWGGSRPELRRTVRRVLRPHRRNRSYLCWVLRRAAANSVFALALLGLHGQPAIAAPPHNPLGMFDGGSQSGSNTTPTFADLDGDGDLDVVEGESYGAFQYYENVGCPGAPSFVERTGGANPLDGVDIGRRSAPTLGDLDGDGDLDLVAGELYGTFVYFENTGTPADPIFEQRIGPGNPLNGFHTQDRSTPEFADLDGDGDLDLVAGELYGEFLYFKNTGTPTNPVFEEQTAGDNPFDGLDTGSNASPTLADLDSDGDFDLVSGEGVGFFRYFENVGTANSPVYVEHTGAANPLDGLATFRGRSKPALGDLDGDGDFDLIAGDYSAALDYFENTGSASSPRFTPSNPLSGFEAGFTLGRDSAPTFADLDADGDLDLASGNTFGRFEYFQNIGSVADPAFVERTGGANPLSGFSVGNSSKPAFADLDADDDFDLVSGNGDGTFAYFENIGTSVSPVFVERVGGNNPFDGFDLSYPEQFNSGNSTPALVDLDGDGDLDLLAGEWVTGAFTFFENTGSATSPNFIERSGAANPLDGFSLGFISEPAPTFVDLDNDGDYDLVTGTRSGTFRLFENAGSATIPDFLPATPLNGLDVGYNITPTFADLDGDGDLDLVAGESYGRFMYFENSAALLILPKDDPEALARAIAPIGTTADTTPGWNGLNGTLFGTGGTETIGQTVVAPPGAPALRSFAFFLDDRLDPDPIDFKAYVVRWDGTKAVAPVLYESPVQRSTNNGGLGGTEEFRFLPSGLELVEGQEYVLILSAFFDGTQSTAILGDTFVNGYAGGQGLFLASGGDFSTVFTDMWRDFGVFNPDLRDWAFVANFSEGTGISILPGTITFSGSSTSAGTFSATPVSGVGIGAGLILTSGDAGLAVGPNGSTSSSQSNVIGGDADLSGLIPQVSTLDASVLQFDFTTEGGDLSFEYVFASEEYNESVGLVTNDVFGAFLDGVNFALIPGTADAVAINNVNEITNSGFFRDNDVGPCDPMSSEIEYDGLTTVLTATALDVTPGVHTLKLAIADTTDFSFDSAVFIGRIVIPEAPSGILRWAALAVLALIARWRPGG